MAKKYIDTDHLSLAIVGDRTTIGPSILKTGIAPIVHLDVEGRPVLTL